MRVYFASLEDLMVKVMGASSVGASSAMAGVQAQGAGAVAGVGVGVNSADRREMLEDDMM